MSRIPRNIPDRGIENRTAPISSHSALTVRDTQCIVIPMNPKTWTVTDYAQTLDLPVRRVRGMCARGEIPCIARGVGQGRRYYVLRCAAERLRQMTKGKGNA